MWVEDLWRRRRRKLFCIEKWSAVSPIVNIIMKIGYNKLRNFWHENYRVHPLDPLLSPVTLLAVYVFFVSSLHINSTGCVFQHIQSKIIMSSFLFKQKVLSFFIMIITQQTGYDYATITLIISILFTNNQWETKTCLIFFACVYNITGRQKERKIGVVEFLL